VSHPFCTPLTLLQPSSSRVVGQPSSVTSYVILGSDAGPSKLQAIKKHNLRTLNEDEFLHLIATRKGPGGPNAAGLDPKLKKKLEKEQEAIRQGAKELELREKKAAKENAHVARGFALSYFSLRLYNLCDDRSKNVDMSSQLWTTRYAPQNFKEICGNKGQVEKLQQWLNDW